MSLMKLDTKSVPDTDDSTIYTPTATSENADTSPEENHDLSPSIPSHELTVIIRSISSGQVITLIDGNVVLASPGSCGSIHWTCVETEGWIGFRNRVSNKFLCHDGNGRLKCTADQRDGWRQFTVTPMPDEGYIMQMLDWWKLRPIVIDAEKGLQKLGRNGNNLSEGIVWEFIKVG